MNIAVAYIEQLILAVAYIEQLILIRLNNIILSIIKFIQP